MLRPVKRISLCNIVTLTVVIFTLIIGIVSYEQSVKCVPVIKIYKK